jgi:HSP20 family protein
MVRVTAAARSRRGTIAENRMNQREKAMSNILIRKRGIEKAIPSAPAELAWDPWRTMRALLAWDPFRDVAPLSFDEHDPSLAPAFDVKETKDAYVFKADVPGIEEKDLDVTLAGNRLTVSGKRHEEKEEKADHYYTYERHYGSFARSFTLPEGANVGQVGASLDKGVLTIHVPKKVETQPQKIAVKAESHA